MKWLRVRPSRDARHTYVKGNLCVVIKMAHRPAANLFLTREKRYPGPASSMPQPDSVLPSLVNCTASAAGLLGPSVSWKRANSEPTPEGGEGRGFREEWLPTGHTGKSMRWSNAALDDQSCYFLTSHVQKCVFFIDIKRLWGPSSNQGVGGSIPALVDVSLSKTPNPDLLPVAVSTYEWNRMGSRFG